MGDRKLKYTWIFIALTAIIITTVGASTYSGVGSRALDQVLWPYTGEARNAYALRSATKNASIGRDCFNSGATENILSQISSNDLEQLILSCGESKIMTLQDANNTVAKLTARCFHNDLIFERRILNFRGFDLSMPDLCTVAVLSTSNDPGVGVATKSDYETDD